MIALLSPKLWLAMGLALLLAASHGFVYKSGRAAVRVQWDKERAEQMAAALIASEAARKKETELQTKVQKVANDYQTEKKRRAADARIAAERLSELEAALDRAAGTDTGADAGDHGDPRSAIIAQCAGAAVILDEAVKRLAGQTSALQSYASTVCLAK